MNTKITLDAIFTASHNIVVREVEYLLIIIPVTSDPDNTDDQPYLLNATGQSIWRRLDGRNNLKKIIDDLASDFEMPVKLIKRDVITFVQKLLNRKMIIEIPQP